MIFSKGVLRSSLMSAGIVLAIVSLVFQTDVGSWGNAASAGSDAADNGTEVALSVTVAKTHYGRREPVEFRFVLENVSSKPVTVCPVGGGVVHIDLFYVNGVVPKHEEYVQSLHVWEVIKQWTDEQSVLAPGEAVEFGGPTYPNPYTNNGPALADLFVEKTSDGKLTTRTRSYFDSGPGTYSLVFRYEYEGPQHPSLAPVYRGTLYSSEVTFVVE